VLISAEGDLPEVLCAHQVTGPPESVHHLLYYATLFIGESATMASESATLGTPAIFVSSTTRGYTNEQEREYDLVYTFSDPVRGQDQALAKAEMILSDPDSKAKWQAKRDRMLADKTDVTQFIVDIVEKYGLGR
jgi:predicted glycosyltransferase